MRVIPVTGASLMAAVFLAAAAQAQTLVAVDDSFGVPYGEALVVEAPGVLDNDTYNGEPAEDAGATADLLSGPTYGFLSCEGEPTFELCPDGSFTYTPGAFFPGIDTFKYEAVLTGEPSSEATVTLTACSGGPTVFTCWKEAPYLAKLGELEYQNFQEGFEDDAAWGDFRSPDTALSVISQGIAWQTNHPDSPAMNEITTGTGPARTGLWGVYDPDHGYATGTPTECDVPVPPPLPPECLFKDGFTGTWQTGKLYGVGGHFTGSSGPNLVMILDGGARIGLGLVPTGDPQFFGVIDNMGFKTFRVEETDGKVGQERLVFGDDFTFGMKPADTTPPQVSLLGSVADTGDGELAEAEVTGVPITQLLVSYDELVREEGEEGADSVTNVANYLLFSDGGNGFDTVDCTEGVRPGDVAVLVDWVTYTSGSERLAVVAINGGVALPAASYRLLVCGTTSVRDWAGNALDGDGNGTGGDDFQRTFTVTGIVGCSVDADCDDGLFCTGTETCAAGVCQAGSDPCPGQMCDEAGDVCAECLVNADCDDGLFCTGTETCAAGVCQAGSDPCPGEMCDEAGDVCAECLVNADCDDGLFCTGTETCAAGVCQAGSDPCPGEMCDEAGDVCAECLVNADCDDGLFCTGTETCAAGVCQAGSDPCPGQMCDEAGDVCAECLVNADCDDGLFCTGTETCAAGVCQAGSDPCPGQMCDEAGDVCAECLVNADCDDGLFCTGTETCAAGVCQAGSDPCPGQMCDEAGDVCAECLVNADCDDGLFCTGTETCAAGVCQAGTAVACNDDVSCTVDSCNEGTDSCNHTPNDTNCPDDGVFCNGTEFCDLLLDCSSTGDPCPPLVCNEEGNVCINCLVDADCDNGLFCDGTETCDAVLGCQAGTVVACNDDVSCTVDSCNEGIDSCDHTPDNGLCDNKLYCDGTETCDTTLDCQAGTAVVCSDDVTCTDDSCNEGTDSCDHAPNDTNCPDDGVFCNGTEFCDLLLDCSSTGDPCPEGEVCNVVEDTCEVQANEPPEIVDVTLTTQSVQYSDAIDAVVITVTDSGSAPLSIEAAGVPAALSFGPADCTATGSGIECSFTLEGQLLAVAGTYEVTVTVSDGSLESDPETFSIVVEPENAEIAFDEGNPASVQVDEPGGDSGTFSLAVQVIELEDPRGVPGDRNLAGDIGLVQVTMTLEPVGPGTSTTGVCSHSAIDPGDLDPESDFDYDTLTVVCDFDNVEENSYLVTVGVDGGFYSGSSEDIFAVVDPSLGFTNGGGWFYWPGTEDPDNNYPGDRTNFAFKVKDDKQGGEPIGHLVLISHLNSRGSGAGSSSSLRLQASSFVALSMGRSADAGGSFDWATFGGVGTLNGPGVPTDMEVTFLVYLEDRGKRKHGGDRFWLEVLDTQANLVPELSLGRPAPANAVTLAGGNLTAHQGRVPFWGTGGSKGGGLASTTTTSAVGDTGDTSAWSGGHRLHRSPVLKFLPLHR